jgi:hypothetical protein
MPREVLYGARFIKRPPTASEQGWRHTLHITNVCTCISGGHCQLGDGVQWWLLGSAAHLGTNHRTRPAPPCSYTTFEVKEQAQRFLVMKIAVTWPATCHVLAQSAEVRPRTPCVILWLHCSDSEQHSVPTLFPSCHVMSCQSMLNALNERICEYAMHATTVSGDAWHAWCADVTWPCPSGHTFHQPSCCRVRCRPEGSQSPPQPRNAPATTTQSCCTPARPCMCLRNFIHPFLYCWPDGCPAK